MDEGWGGEEGGKGIVREGRGRGEESEFEGK